MSEFSNLGRSGVGPSDQVFFGLPGVYVEEGAHIAHFFKGEAERFNVLAPFIQAGLEAGDQCVIIAEPSAPRLITDRLKKRGVEVEANLDSGQLLISEGSTEIEKMALMLESVISLAATAGRKIIRIGGDMTWTLSKMPTAEKLLEWEAFYDQRIGPLASFVALCQYDHMRFGGSAVMCALQTHPLSIIGGIVQENPFYQDPHEFLQEMPPRRVSAGN